MSSTCKQSFYCFDVLFPFLQARLITPQLALTVLLKFDRAINDALASRLKNKITFKVRHGNVTFVFISLKPCTVMFFCVHDGHVIEREVLWPKCHIDVHIAIKI